MRKAYRRFCRTCRLQLEKDEKRYCGMCRSVLERDRRVKARKEALMGGMGGKRANPPDSCRKCKKDIQGEFYRMKDGDYCKGCGEEKIQKEAERGG